MSQPTSFTGRRRERKTRWTVKAVDRIATGIVALGGIGTILAVLLVCVFLTAVAVPLFFDASTQVSHSLPAPVRSEQILQWRADEYQTMAWTFSRDGRLRSFRLDNGALLEDRSLFEGAQVTSAAFAIDGDQVGVGFSDGTVRLGTIGFETTFLGKDQVTPEIDRLKANEIAVHDGGIVERTGEGQLRAQKLNFKFQPPIKSTAASSVTLLDYAVKTNSTVLCTFTADSRLHLQEVTQRTNLLTGQVTLKASNIDIPFVAPAGKGPPDFLLLSGQGDNVYLIWKDGLLLRFNTVDHSNSFLAEELSLLPDGGEVTCVGAMIGKATLVVADSQGVVRGWFSSKPADSNTLDGIHFINGQALARWPSAVTALSTSSRGRMLAAGHADGRVRLFNMTTGKLAADLSVAQEPASSFDAVTGMAIAPKDDGLLASSARQIRVWHVDAPHMDVTLASMFRPVWYEGYERPEHAWQSSSGSDQFETKFGLMSLIFGTVKATFYAMLFGAPLALLAAVFTSEFLSPQARGIIKPAIELMASLPSVVLGFLAALVIAPVVEASLVPILLLLVTIPLSLLSGAYLWQLLPIRWSILAARYRFLAILFSLPLGALAAWTFAGPVEHWLFADNIMLWLDGQRGTGLAAWLMLLLPICFLAAISLMSAVVNPWLRGRSHAQVASLDMIKFGATLLITVGAALAVAAALTMAGFDPRGSFVDTYVQRNAMVVGFVMGFAIIPIIYTIAEDALTSVPGHLRAASLGSGATHWQTAVHIIVPTAMSGLFSALMIGLGRAVGETMIVLMAAGNTAVMEWNLFNGFRTLSANIAVELPEAVRDSTHYRILFLSALALFAMTFVINTAAEVFRMRIRKRTFEL